MADEELEEGYSFSDFRTDAEAVAGVAKEGYETYQDLTSSTSSSSGAAPRRRGLAEARAAKLNLAGLGSDSNAAIFGIMNAQGVGWDEAVAILTGGGQNQAVFQAITSEEPPAAPKSSKKMWYIGGAVAVGLGFLTTTAAVIGYLVFRKKKGKRRRKR